MLVYEIMPKAAPRITQGTIWKHEAYFTWKAHLKCLALKSEYVIPEMLEDITFVLPMPASWKAKKKQELDGKPHQQTPDLDNMVKAFKDAICDRDEYVHTYNNVRKIWGPVGLILIGKEDGIRNVY